MITTSEIPNSLLKPGNYTQINTLTGLKGNPAYALKFLLVGQMTAAATVAANTPVQAFSPAEVAAYFGAGSVVHRMSIAAFAKNRNLALWVMGQEDAADSTAATGTIVFAGTATTAGSYVLLAGRDRVEIPFAVGQTAAGMATAVAAAINANVNLPFTATAAVATVTRTAKNKGTVGNQIASQAAISGAGLTHTTAATLTTGATDPNLQTSLDAVFPTQFHIIAYWGTAQADFTALRDHLNSAGSAIEQRPGRYTVGISPTATLSAAVALAVAVQAERGCAAYFRGTISPAFEIAATYGAALASQDQVNLPLNGEELPVLSIPDVSQRITRTEQETLLAAGVTPIEVNELGAATIVKAVSMRTATAGAPDLTLLSTATIATLDYVRFVWNSRIKIKYRNRLFSDLLLDALEEEAYAMCLELEKPENGGYLDRVAQHRAQFQSARDANYTTRARVAIPAAVVPGLDQIYTRIDLFTL